MKHAAKRIPVPAWRRLSYVAVVAIAALLGVASAHATVVFGTLTVEPNPPPVGAPFRLELTLDDPTGAPVEDAIAIAELTPIEADEPLAEIDPEGEPLVTTRFEETQPGTYRAEASAPSAGSYRTFQRDQTFA